MSFPSSLDSGIPENGSDKSEGLVSEVAQRMAKVQHHNLITSRIRQQYCAKRNPYRLDSSESNSLLIPVQQLSPSTGTRTQSEPSENILQREVGRTREYLDNLNKITRKSHEVRRKNPFDWKESIEGNISFLDMKSNGLRTVVKATKFFKEILSEKSAIDRVILSGAVPYIAQLLEFDIVKKNYVSLTKHAGLGMYALEAIWAITSITLGTSEQIKYLEDIGCISLLTNILDSPFEEVKSDALFSLGNICDESIQFRDSLLKHGITSKVVHVLETESSEFIRSGATNLFLNLLRKNPAPPLEVFTKAIPVLVKLLPIFSHYDSLSNTCRSLCYGFKHSNDDILQVAIESGILPLLIGLLDKRSMRSVAVKTIGTIILQGNDNQTSQVLKCGLLEHFSILIKCRGVNDLKMRRDIVWALSNIVTGSTENIQMVIDSNIISSVTSILSDLNEDENIHLEGYWFFANMFTKANAEQIKYLIEQGLFQPLCEGLRLNDTQLYEVLLSALKRVLLILAKEQGMVNVEESGHVERILENM